MDNELSRIMTSETSQEQLMSYALKFDSYFLGLFQMASIAQKNGRKINFCSCMKGIFQEFLKDC